MQFLIVEDSESDAFLIERALRKEWPGVSIEWILSGAQFDVRLTGTKCDLVICDFNLPGFDAWGALRRLKLRWPDVPLLILSGAVGEETAVELMKAGAADVILKSQTGRVIPAIRRALSLRDAARGEIEARRIAEGAIRAREETLAIVSHDLRSPLATILLLSQLQLEKNRGVDDEAYLAFQKIRRAAGFMRTLIEDVLLYDSGVKNDLVLSCNEFNYAQFAKELMEMFEPLARERKLQFSAEILADDDVYADRDRLLQCVSNLISNAFKFSPRGGKVLVRFLREERNLIIEVLDSGPGVPKSLREKVFEKYYQAEDRDYRGKGLGLHIVKTIATKHGGNAQCLGEESLASHPRASEYGGSVFRVSLPAVRLDKRLPDACGVSAPHVFFVDDDEDLRFLIGGELRGRGFVVEEYASIEEARCGMSASDLSDFSVPRIALVDYFLPDGKGTDFVQWLRTHSNVALARLPVLLMSAEMNLSSIASEAEVDGFLSKPPVMNELVKEVSRFARLQKEAL